MKENIIMKMISRRDFMKASAVVGAAGVLTACGGSSSSTAAPPSSSSTVSRRRQFWIPTLASAATLVQTHVSPVLIRAS